MNLPVEALQSIQCETYRLFQILYNKQGRDYQCRVYLMLCFYKSCLNIAAPLSKCTVVGEKSMSLCLFFRRRQKSEIYRRRRRFTKILLYRGVLSFQVNACTHSAAAIIKALRRLRLGFSQTPDLVPNDCHIFGSLKKPCVDKDLPVTIKLMRCL